MIRGIERRKIFWNKRDRSDFLDRLADLLPETELADSNNYAYCGHSALTVGTKHPWQDVDYAVSYFGKTRNRALRGYCSYPESGLNQGRWNALTRHLGLSVPIIGYSVERGEIIARENGYRLAV
jgi:hypothetical protein